jgi:hypothetical protein
MGTRPQGVSLTGYLDFLAGGSHSFLGALCCLSAPAVDRIDSMSGRQRHSATLQQLLAWEKKLYKDVKVNKKLLTATYRTNRLQHCCC